MLNRKGRYFAEGLRNKITFIFLYTTKACDGSLLSINDICDEAHVEAAQGK